MRCRRPSPQAVGPLVCVGGLTIALSALEGPALKRSVRGAPPHSLVAHILGSGLEPGCFRFGFKFWAEELLIGLGTFSLLDGLEVEWDSYSKVPYEYSIVYTMLVKILGLPGTLEATCPSKLMRVLF